MKHTFSIFLPKLPPSLNARMHFMKRHRLVAEARRSAGMQAKSARIEFSEFSATEPRAIHIHVIRGKYGGRAQDDDNLRSSCKPVIDSLGDPKRASGMPSDAGWLVDDSPRWLTAYTTEQSVDRSISGVVLRVTVENADG